MTISLTATCTNNTSVTLTFQSMSAIHGTNPLANPTVLASGQSAVVSAVPIDTVLGPSPAGSFEWLLPGGAGGIVFAYDLHDTPISIAPTSIPNGYAVPQCSINQSGAAMVVITSST
jgi:hypothetical protein